MISIVIPSWNNLACLKLCIESLHSNSAFEHEIIVHLNDGSDGSLEWIKSEGIKYTQTPKNVGVCLAVNHAVAHATNDWVLYLNDDMVAAPGWDKAFTDAIASVPTDLALFFGTQIMAESRGMEGIIQQDFGASPADFNLERFRREAGSLPMEDQEGAASQPTLFHRKWWAMLGGYSLEFSPGMSSDDDLLMKFWVAGCRNFRMVGASRFYHFGCVSTGRIRHNRGGHIFTMKWGITQIEFYRRYMASLRRPNRGATAGNPHNVVRPTWLGKLRRVRYALRHNAPLDGIEAWDSLPGLGEWNSGNLNK